MRPSLLVPFATAICLSQAMPGAYSDGLVPRATQQSCKKSKTPPSGSICGVKGHVTSPSPTESTLSDSQAAVVTTELQCLDTCLAQPSGCTSYSWNSATKTCTYYTESVKGMGFKSGKNSAITYQDYDCYTCNGQKAFLENANFETGATSPWFQDSGYVQDSYTITSPGYKSKYAANLTTAPNGGSGIQQFAYQVPGASYVMSFDYMFVNNVDGFIAGFTSEDAGDESEQVRVATGAVATGTWNTATGSGATANGDGLLEVLCRSYDTNNGLTCLVDNVKYTLQ